MCFPMYTILPWKMHVTLYTKHDREGMSSRSSTEGGGGSRPPAHKAGQRTMTYSACRHDRAERVGAGVNRQRTRQDKGPPLYILTKHTLCLILYTIFNQHQYTNGPGNDTQVIPIRACHVQTSENISPCGSSCIP